MSFDLDKLQAVADLGEVIRLHNDALDRLTAFRKARPYMVMPNLMKLVEENLKENLQVLYKEFNNLHKPAEQQTRYICNDCKMAFLVKLPGGICDECRVKRGTKPRDYVLQPRTADEDEAQIQPEESSMVAEPAEGEVAVDQVQEEIAADVENATAGDKAPVDVEETVAEEMEQAAEKDEMSEEFQKFMGLATDSGKPRQATEAADPTQNSGSAKESQPYEAKADEEKPDSAAEGKKE